MLSRHKFSAAISLSWCRNCVIYLAISWCLGLIIGALFSYETQSISISLMRTAASTRVSIVWLLVLRTAPLVLSAIAIYLRLPYFTLIIVFFKAFIFGFAACGTVWTFFSSGWLITSLLMFSDFFMVIPLLYFWIRHISGTQSYLRRDFIVSLLLSAALCIADYLFVSPFLAVLMDI